MELNGLPSPVDTLAATPLRVKRFPPGRRGVLLPVSDRRAAALGMTMYTASKPWVVAGQRAVHRVVARSGARVLPGRIEEWEPPVPGEAWVDLLDQWRSAVGDFDAISIYERRQSTRTGLTVLLTHAGAGAAVVKMRLDDTGLAAEQRALAAVEAFGPRTFRAPGPLGWGEQDRWTWSAQTTVFDRPHGPALALSPETLEEIAGCLAPLTGGAEGMAPAHNDLSPWNLRQDSAGRLWLYDWEDSALSPAGVDRTYFAVTALVLGGGPLPDDLPAAAVDHVRALLTRRLANAEDGAFNGAMLAALDRTG